MSFNRLITHTISFAALVLLMAACRAQPNPVLTPTHTPEPPTAAITLLPGATPIPAITATAMGIPTIVLSPNPYPHPADCPPPSGWSPIKIQAGDTLEGLAQAYNATTDALIQANCLLTDVLIAGTLLYVPGVPPTESPIQCGPPPGWIFYTVQSGETLFRIGLAFGVSVAELQYANCLGSSTLIRAGTRIFVPSVNTRTPTTAPTHTATSTPHP